MLLLLLLLLLLPLLLLLLLLMLLLLLPRFMPIRSALHWREPRFVEYLAMLLFGPSSNGFGWRLYGGPGSGVCGW